MAGDVVRLRDWKDWQYTIRVRHAPAFPCTAAECEVPATRHVIWLQGGMLRQQPVCLGHAEALHERGGCAVCPVGTLPPIEVVARAVREYQVKRAQERKQARDAEAQDYYHGFFTAHTTSSTNFGGATVFTFNIR